MSRERRELRHYARLALGVERLPAGVPALLDDLLVRIEQRPIPTGAIHQALRPYRKPWLAL